MYHSDEETQVQPYSLWETAVGGTWMMKTLKKGWDVSLRAVTIYRGEEEYMERKGGQGVRE